MGFTVTTLESIAEHPPPFVPVTVYVVVEVGFTEMEAVWAPVFHTYEEAPLAVIVAVSPLQILAAVTFNEAAAKTLTVTV